MKLSSKIILATFNTSKSGKSFIRIDGDTMLVVNSNIATMIKAGEVEEVEFQAGSDLMDKADPTKVAFKTMQVKDFTTSRIHQLHEANKLIKAIKAFNDNRYKAAMKKLEGLTL